MGTESLVAELLRIAPDIEVRVMHFDARSKSQRRHTTHNRAPPPPFTSAIPLERLRLAIRG